MAAPAHAERISIYELISALQVEGSVEPAFQYAWEAVGVRNANETPGALLARWCATQLGNPLWLQQLRPWRDEIYALLLCSVQAQSLLTTGG